MADIQRGLVQMLIDLDRRARPGRESRYRAIQKFTGLLDTVQMSSESLTTTVATPPYQYARQSYRSAVVADAPSAYWRLGEYAPAVTANDEMATYPAAYSGVLLGYVGPGPSEPDCAAVFSSSASRATTSSTNLSTVLNASQWSIECWINLQAQSTYAGAVMGPRLGASARIFGTTWSTGGVAFVEENIAVIANSSVPLTTGAWTQIVYTYTNSSTLRRYKNGSLLGSSTYAFTASFAGVYSLGTTSPAAAAGSDQMWLDEFSIYATPLSSDRVLAHYNAMTTPTATGTSLVAGAGQFR